MKTQLTNNEQLIGKTIVGVERAINDDCSRQMILCFDDSFAAMDGEYDEVGVLDRPYHMSDETLLNFGLMTKKEFQVIQRAERQRIGITGR